MVNKNEALENSGTAAGRIDSNHLQALLNMQGNVAVPISGKVINVAHQIPYDCVLNRSSVGDMSTVDQLRLFAAASRRSRENSVASNGSASSSSLDSAPISHLAKRRSTLPALGESPSWRLCQRRGHSAMYAGIDSLKQNYRTLYLGSTGNIVSTVKDHIPADQVTEDERESLCQLLMSKHSVVPLFIDDHLAHGHYEGYCKQVLWPVLHYIMWADCVDEGKFWEAYVAVNHIFAEKIAEVYEKGDLVFVHDYHLLLVPGMLREMIPEARIGLFVHTPFVSSEIFRCLPRRRDLLLGMLGANLVSFQTYNYARHFASNCVRILGFEYTPNGVDANGNIVSLGIHPIGIDVDRTRKHCLSPGVEPKMRAMREKYKDKKIVVGRDKLDPVKGVLQKLDSFEKFLQDYPEWRDKVVLIQVTSPGVVGSPRLDTKMAEAVNRINSKFGSLEFSPVQLFHQHIDRDEYYALLTVADALLVTSTADGMNTTSLEFIVAQERGNYAPLILSEFTGTARSLSAALIVNPYDYADVAAAIDESLTMSEEDKREKFLQISQFVNSHTASYWANSLVKDLVASAAQESYWGPSPKLEVDRLMTEYKESGKRLLFFDYDGTLVPICEKPEDAAPSKETVEALEKLCADPDNVVWVVSGRDQATLEKWLGHIPQLGLSSEHGCFIRDPGKKTVISMIEQLDMSWKEDVLEIFKYYTERTPGSFIEQKRCALTWHYRTSDPKFGAFQAKECQNHLDQSVISKLPVETLVGKKTLEVRPQVINKGEVIRRALTQHPDASFVLCAGDDKTDEDMFRVLAKIKTGGISQILFTVSVGPADKRTIANWHVESTQEFNQILRELAKTQHRSHKLD